MDGFYPRFGHRQRFDPSRWMRAARSFALIFTQVSILFRSLFTSNSFFLETYLVGIDLLEILHDAEHAFGHLCLVEEGSSSFGGKATRRHVAERGHRLQFHVRENGRSHGRENLRHRHVLSGARDDVLFLERTFLTPSIESKRSIPSPKGPVLRSNPFQKGVRIGDPFPFSTFPNLMVSPNRRIERSSLSDVGFDRRGLRSRERERTIRIPTKTPFRLDMTCGIDPIESSLEA